MMWLPAYVELHNTNLPGARFKIGDFVHYDHPLIAGDGHVRAVNHIDDNEYEYAIGGVINLLFWENELKPIKEATDGSDKVLRVGSGTARALEDG
jgi:hypothetical protein